MTQNLQQGQEGLVQIFSDPKQAFTLLSILGLVLLFSAIFLRHLARTWLKSSSWQSVHWPMSLVFAGIALYGFLQIIFGSAILSLSWIQDSYMAKLIVYWLSNGTWSIAIIICMARLSGNIQVLGIRWLSWKQALAAILSYVAFFPWYWAAYFITQICFYIFAIPIQAQEIAQEFISSQGWTTYLAIATIVVIAPASEELVFRVFFYTALRNHFGPTKALLITSAIFALVHGNSFVFLPIFALGLCLNLLYEQTQCIWVPILVHSIHNSLTLGYLLLLP